MSMKVLGMSDKLIQCNLVLSRYRESMIAVDPILDNAFNIVQHTILQLSGRYKL